MHQRHLALALNAIAYLAAPAEAQFVSGPLEPATPALPHTAVYTTTVAQNNPPQVITIVVVTLIVPRDVGRPNNGSLITGTAISHFSASQQNGAVSTCSDTAELAWTIAQDGKDAPPAKTTLTAAYTDYQHFSMGLYGAWAVYHYDFLLNDTRDHRGDGGS